MGLPPCRRIDAAYAAVALVVGVVASQASAQAPLPPAMPGAAPITFDVERVGFRGEAGALVAQAEGVAWRWWLQSGRAQVGFGLGRLATAQVPLRPDDATGAAAAATLLSLGLRWQVDAHSTLYADAAGARRLIAAAQLADSVGAKVGVEWSPARPRLGFEAGALGVQLDSGLRMALRARHGGLGVYLRGRF